jgi:hypothetical protein
MMPDPQRHRSSVGRNAARETGYLPYRSPVIADDQAQDLHEKVTTAQEGERHPLTDVLLSGVVTAGEDEGCVGAAIAVWCSRTYSGPP